MREEIIGQSFDEERALYNLSHADVIDCIFAGPADGESVLKEARDVSLENCSFSLRYPLWHVEGFQLHDSKMDELTRAAIWYAKDGTITDSVLGGIKAVRECENIVIKDCSVTSEEFGWMSSRIRVEDSTLASQYIFFGSRDVALDRVKMTGKYSFQYMENLTISNSVPRPVLHTQLSLRAPDTWSGLRAKMSLSPTASSRASTLAGSPRV